MCFSPIFSGVFLNVICYSKRILWYNVFGFVLSSEVKKLRPGLNVAFYMRRIELRS